jgi:hypothetical protein
LFQKDSDYWSSRTQIAEACTLCGAAFEGCGYGGSELTELKKIRKNMLKNNFSSDNSLAEKEN